jgi:hypothetical protein
VGDLGRAYQAFKTIMAAARRGAIPPESAVNWARRVARGESVDVLASVSGPTDPRTRWEWMAAAVGPDL